MSSIDRSIQFAHQIWPRLIILAETRGMISQQTLGKRFGITGRALHNFDQILAPLQAYCSSEGLPRLSALIVKKDSDIPGSDPAAIDTEAVYAYNWRGRSPIIPSEDDLTLALKQDTPS